MNKESATHQALDSKYQILLYYLYSNIENPNRLMKEQKKLWKDLGLTGRMIIAHEGINATLEGLKENTEKYIELMVAIPELSKIHWKKSVGTGKAFPKASIKVRKEVVTLGLGEQDFSPNQVTGKYLQPEELHQWIQEKKDFVFIDMRNDYEHKVGKFAGSVCPTMKSFRDLPKKIQNELDQYKDKTVVTVCTGGIRCEKASGYLVQNGFKDVYQLYGGIVSYMEKYPNEDFEGKLYVFDNRVMFAYNTDDSAHKVLGECEMCHKTSERYVNCKNVWCNLHFICCFDCGPNEKPYCKSCHNVFYRLYKKIRRKYFTKDKGVIYG